MKILFVSLFLPQEKAYHAGGRYVFEMIRGLSQRHEIHLVTRLEESELPLLGVSQAFLQGNSSLYLQHKGKKGAS